MNRPVWSGHITFGLVPIPVRLFSGEETSDLQFRLLDSRNLARIRYERVNEETGEEVPWDQTTKAYELDNKSFVVLSEEELKDLKVHETKTIELEAFVPAEQIKPIYYEKPYILEPDEKGDKLYVLLREALRESNKLGIARVSIRSRQYLSALIPFDEALVLDILRFQQQLVPLSDFKLPNKAPSAYGVGELEIQLAKELIEAMSTNWNPQMYHDEYREALMSYVRQKYRKQLAAARRERIAARAEAEMLNLMELLRKSLRERRGRSASGESS